MEVFLNKVSRKNKRKINTLSPAKDRANKPATLRLTATKALIY